ARLPLTFSPAKGLDHNQSPDRINLTRVTLAIKGPPVVAGSYDNLHRLDHSGVAGTVPTRLALTVLTHGQQTPDCSTDTDNNDDGCPDRKTGIALPDIKGKGCST